MNVIREIDVFEKGKDILITSIVVNVSLSILKKIFHVDDKEDPNVYKVYELNKKQYLLLSELVSSLKEYDFNDVEMFYDCHQK